MTRYYSLFDTKANTFAPLFSAPSDAVAMRSIADFLKSDDKSPPVTHPEDFKLFYMLSVDDVTGEVLTLKTESGHSYVPNPQFVVELSSLKEVQS